jgi:hypothetical protein
VKKKRKGNKCEEGQNAGRRSSSISDGRHGRLATNDVGKKCSFFSHSFCLRFPVAMDPKGRQPTRRQILHCHHCWGMGAEQSHQARAVVAANQIRRFKERKSVSEPREEMEKLRRGKRDARGRPDRRRRGQLMMRKRQKDKMSGTGEDPKRQAQKSRGPTKWHRNHRWQNGQQRSRKEGESFACN